MDKKYLPWQKKVSVQVLHFTSLHFTSKIRIWVYNITQKMFLSPRWELNQWPSDPIYTLCQCAFRWAAYWRASKEIQCWKWCGWIASWWGKWAKFQWRRWMSFACCQRGRKQVHFGRSVHLQMTLPIVCLTLSHPEALPWRVKSSGVRQSKITKGNDFGRSGRGKVNYLTLLNLFPPKPTPLLFYSV